MLFTQLHCYYYCPNLKTLANISEGIFSYAELSSSWQGNYFHFIYSRLRVKTNIWITRIELMKNAFYEIDDAEIQQ